MTLRRHIFASGLCTALCLGALAMPSPASAAPATPAHPAPTYTVLGRDALAPYADAAMNAWLEWVGGDRKALHRFDLIRNALALEAGRRLGIDGTLLQAAWRKADRTHQLALVAAMTQLGTPYRTNSSVPGSGFDCSGLTTWAWAQVGISLPRQSRTQINTVRRVTREEAQAGDLIYYPGHVSLWLGVDDLILHAPYTGRSVEFSHIRSGRSVLFGNPQG